MADDMKVRNGKAQNGSGGPTRRRVLAGSSIGLGAAVLSPLPLRFALAQSKPYRIGTMQPLSGAAAIIGKTALVGAQRAVDRINKPGGVHRRPGNWIVTTHH